MNPNGFLRTIYLGDRTCRSIIIDGWTSTLAICIDVISRVRSATGSWELYTDEDILEGCLVFSGVDGFRCSFDGVFPNDFIEVRCVGPCSSSSGAESFAFEIASVPLIRTLHLPRYR